MIRQVGAIGRTITLRRTLVAPSAPLFALALGLTLLATPLAQARPFIAFSLAMADQALARCRLGVDCPEGIEQLDGITHLWGFQIQPGQGDIRLLGYANPDRPPLGLADLLVALRAAHFRYGVVSGNTRIIEPAGCTIDPDPLDFAELRTLASQGNLSASWQRWREICGRPQSVRVLGVPHDSHMAAVFVEADYHMKRIANGSDALGIPAWRSHQGLIVDDLRDRWARGDRKLDLSGGFNSFWFRPGKASVGVDGNIVTFMEVPVALDTEAQALANRATITKAAAPDPLAEAFAQSFTQRYDEVAKIRPIYAELAGMYALIAVAEAIRVEDGFRRAGLGMDRFLETAPIPSEPVATELPGLAHRDQLRLDERDGRSYVEVSLPSCGGVIAWDIYTNANQVAVRHAILDRDIEEARPDYPVLSWIVYPSGPALGISQRM